MTSHPIQRKLGTLAALTRSPDRRRLLASALRKNLRSASLKFRRKPFVYALEPGFSFLVDPASKTSVGYYLNGALHEEIEMHLCSAWLRAGDACMDVGANVGVYTTLFASHVGSGGKVVAIEPALSTYGTLTTAVRELGLHQVVTLNVCVSDQEGTVEFLEALPEGSDTMASIQMSDTFDTGRFRPRTVPSRPLDALVSECLRERMPSLIKIDVEGAEMLCLQGARGIFEAPSLPLVLIEIAKGQLQRFGASPGEVTRFFRPEDYSLYYIPRSQYDLIPEHRYGSIYPYPADPGHLWPGCANVIAVPRRGAHHERMESIGPLLPVG